jgi:hypothetical protein
MSLPLFTLRGRTPGGIDYWMSLKIQEQMAKRGWSQPDVDDTLDHPDQVVPLQDVRWHWNGRGRRSDPATGFVRRDASNQYVVRNDITGEIVQLSDRNDRDWTTPW